MRNILLLLAALAVFGGWRSWKHGAEEAEAVAAVTRDFVPVVMPTGAPARGVLVLAPPNCPSQEARRAEALVRELRRKGIPVVESDSMSFEIVNPTAEQRAGVDNAVAVFNAGAPAVFVRGRGMSNPSAEQVIAEYRRGRSSG